MNTLTDNRESVILFMNLLRALLTGEPYHFEKVPEEDVWKGLRALCAHHNMYAVIYEQLRLSGIFYSVKEEIELGNVIDGDLDLIPELDENIRSFLYREKEHFRLRAFRMIMIQMHRTMAFEDYYKDILAVGVKPLVIKGMILRDCWPDGNMRVSGDEDLLIRPEDYHKLKGFFLDRGFMMDKEEPEKGLPDEMGFFRKDEDVYYEAHRVLFSEESSFFSRFNDVYNDAFSDAIGYERGDYYFYTLDPTRHLFFVFGHMLKHFVMGGVGIRQLIDIFMFIRRYDREIDRVRLKSLLKGFGLEVYWVNLMEIGRLYLGFEAVDYNMQFFEGIKPDPGDMLADMLDAGIFGGTSIERMHSANITLEAAQRQGLSGRFRGIVRALFPSRAYMEKRYPSIKGKRWLLPVAYIRRFGDYASNRRMRKEVDPKEESAFKIGMQRARLLEKYKIHCQE